ncbi:hypothetical protein PVAR5_3089 [Paecilomyces variotii No. 5]|uniref:Uncharacterized protein n=1 Tax=Byssochlamys spectabilis (strain No. 5 / NBRC 109023) TaxID=1356009 RepID=V5FR54_BYSSN|nr:hypothetical protein PVAR5_3089 [Paecilomyces variotii No. 5]
MPPVPQSIDQSQNGILPSLPTGTKTPRALGGASRTQEIIIGKNDIDSHRAWGEILPGKPIASPVRILARLPQKLDDPPESAILRSPETGEQVTRDSIGLASTRSLGGPSGRSLEDRSILWWRLMRSVLVSTAGFIIAPDGEAYLSWHLGSFHHHHRDMPLETTIIVIHNNFHTPPQNNHRESSSPRQDQQKKGSATGRGSNP